MSDYNCTPQLEKDSKGLTVGQEFIIACDGDWSHFSSDQAELRVDEADKYKLKLLSLKNTDAGAQLIVTSYKAGSHDLKTVQIVNAQESRVLGDLHFQVQSVLDPKTKPEPFGPYGPLRLSLPGWYFVALLIFVVLLVSLVIVRVRSYVQKKKMVGELENQNIAATPFSQFNQTLRRLRREAAFLEGKQEGNPSEKTTFVNELERAYRIYLGRTFLLPTLNWSDALILKDLKKRQKALFLICGSEIDRLLQEFARARTADTAKPQEQTQVQNKDLVQLFELARKNVDTIAVHLKKEGES